jgi:hypothetical protein
VNSILELIHRKGNIAALEENRTTAFVKGLSSRTPGLFVPLRAEIAFPMAYIYLKLKLLASDHIADV